MNCKHRKVECENCYKPTVQQIAGKVKEEKNKGKTESEIYEILNSYIDWEGLR